MTIAFWRQFSLRSLLALVAALAVFFTFAPQVTPLPCVIAVLFATEYVVASKSTIRARSIAAMSFMLLASAPWFSIEDRGVIIPGVTTAETDMQNIVIVHEKVSNAIGMMCVGIHYGKPLAQ